MHEGTQGVELRLERRRSRPWQCAACGGDDVYQTSCLFYDSCAGLTSGASPPGVRPRTSLGVSNAPLARLPAARPVTARPLQCDTDPIDDDQEER